MFGLKTKSETTATMEPPGPPEKPGLPARIVRVRLLVSLANAKRVFRPGEILTVRPATAMRLQESGEGIIVGGTMTPEDAASALDDHGEIEILDSKFHAIAQPNLDLLIAERDRLVAEFAAVGLPHGEYEVSWQLQAERFALERQRYEKWESAKKFAEDFPPIEVVGAESPTKPTSKAPKTPTNWPAKSKRIVALESAIREQRRELAARRQQAAVRQSVRLQAANSHIVSEVNAALEQAVAAIDKLVSFTATFKTRTQCHFSSGFTAVEITTEFAKQLRSLKGDCQRHVDGAKKAGVLSATNYATIDDLPMAPMLDTEMP